jgi:hypothetical protein
MRHSIFGQSLRFFERRSTSAIPRSRARARHALTRSTIISRSKAANTLLHMRNAIRPDGAVG